MGVPVVELCRQAGITEQTFYRWEETVRRPGDRPGAAAETASGRDADAGLKKLSGQRVPGEPASCLPGGASGHLDVSMPKQAGTSDRAAFGDSRDCRGPCALQVSQYSGAAEAREMEGGQEAAYIECIEKRG